MSDAKYLREMVHVATLSPGADRFSAARAAERWAKDNDFACGPMQRDAPRGLMRPRDEYVVAKWRNLNEPERCQLHGLLYRRGNGEVEVWLKQEFVL